MWQRKRERMFKYVEKEEGKEKNIHLFLSFVPVRLCREGGQHPYGLRKEQGREVAGYSIKRNKTG